MMVIGQGANKKTRSSDPILSQKYPSLGLLDGVRRTRVSGPRQNSYVRAFTILSTALAVRRTSWHEVLQRISDMRYCSEYQTYFGGDVKSLD
jgi:hypothetical protein